MCLELLGIVSLVRLWLARTRIIRLRSTETNVLDPWSKKLHPFRIREILKHSRHSRDATRKTLLILLIWRTIAIGVNLWLLLELNKVVPSELAKLERLEEEVQAVS